MKTLLVKENLTNPINFQLKQSSSLSAYVKIWSFLMMMLFCRNVMGQTNYVSWDFNTSITNANYASSQTNQDGARTTALTSTTFGGITLATATASTGSTYHRTSGWPNNTVSVNASAISYIQFSITLSGGQTFPNSSFTLDLNVGTSNATTAPNRLQPIYGYGASPTYATIGSAMTLTTSQTALPTITVPAPGNTTTTVLTIRLAAFATGSTNQTGNIRYQSIALANSNAPTPPTPSIAISNGTIAAGSPNNGQTNVVLQRYDMAVTTANATLTGLTVSTAGSYAAADLTNLKCWYQTSTTFNAGTATLLSTKTTALGPGSQVLPSFTSQAISSGSTGYIFLTADIASGATNGNTINIASNAFSNITFSSGSKTGTDPVAAGGLQTITVAVPDIALTSPSASSANITVGTTNNVIYRFDLAITTATATLNGVTLNTANGSNSSTDLTNLKCWYQTSTTFNTGTATLLSTKTTSLAAGSQVFPSFSSQSLSYGSTYYIFITADVPLSATPNNTIIVSAITTADLTFATGNKTGSANASGTKTIIDCTPTDVTSTAASSANLSSVLTWVNPACYDEILIVAALTSNSGTPTGDGSAYIANLAFGSGTSLGNGFIVYRGLSSSQTVTGLTNGTQYYFKYFTRRGNTWTSGTEVNATPNIAGYYWNGASIAANPAAGGTGTWGAANSWRQPSSVGGQATWANNNNAIFGGTSGSVTVDGTPRIATAFYFNTSGYELITPSGTTTLTGPIVLGNNVGLTLSPNVNVTTPVSGTIAVGNISGTGSANITINSAQGLATNIAQRINIATANGSISVPINITSTGGSGSGTVAGIVGTATGTSLSSAATITNNSSVKTIIGATSGFDITANGVISGSADLMFAAGASGGAGTVTLNAANTYSGATILNAANSGIVKLGVNNALPVSTNLIFGYSSGNGGSLDLNGFNQTLASIINGGFGSGVNKIVNNGNTDATLTINGSTSPTAFVFGLQDGLTNKLLLTKSGSGKLILDGSTTTGGNTYTGLTTVNEGILQLSKAGGNTIPVGNSVTINGGTLQISSNQTLETITFNGGTIQVDNGVTLTINNLTIPNGATLKLVGTGKISGSGTFILSSGATLISEQSISLAVLNYGTKSFSSSANYEFKGTSTGTFETTPTTNTVNDLTIESGAGTTIMNQAFNINGTLSLTSGTLDIGANTLTIGGTVSQTSGNIDADAGTVSFTNSTALSLPTSLFSGNIYNLSKASGAGAVTLNDNLTVTNELNSAASTGAFIIASSKELTISGTCKATINGTITNNGSFTLNSGATLLQGSSSSITNGTYNVKQTITGSGGATPNGRFWYLGSPLSNGLSTALLSSTGNQLWQWDETNVNYATLSSGQTLTQGKSYVLRSGQTSETINFSGTGLSNGTLNVLNLTRTGTSAQMRGCHLVSNPYPSYLDWDLVGKTNVSTTMYVRTALGSNFNVLETYNSFDQIGTSISGTPMTKDIAPMQGFWVKVTADGQTGSLAMDNDMRSHQANGAGLRSSAQNFPAFLRMNVLDGENKDQVILFMSPDATSALDEHDSEKLPVTGSAQIYSIVDAKKLVINGMKNVKAKTSIPLILDLPSSKSYTFQAEEFNIEDGLILLEDKQESVLQDLTINPIYSFFGNVGINTTRFVIHFHLRSSEFVTNDFETNELSANITDFSSQSSHINVLSNGKGQISVNLPIAEMKDAHLEVIDASGRTILKKKLIEKETIINLDNCSGIYYVRVSTYQNIELQKIFVQP